MTLTPYYERSRRRPVQDCWDERKERFDHDFRMHAWFSKGTNHFATFCMECGTPKMKEDD